MITSELKALMDESDEGKHRSAPYLPVSKILGKVSCTASCREQSLQALFHLILIRYQSIENPAGAEEAEIICIFLADGNDAKRAAQVLCVALSCLAKTKL